MSKINTTEQFSAAVLDILESHRERYKGSLEEYLCALWTVLQDYKDVQPSYDLFADVLRQTFTAPSAPFDADWMVYTQPLDWVYVDGAYAVEELEGREVRIIERNADDFRILQHTLLFQIADLHRMQDNEIKNSYRYLGVTSPTGNSWYNFDVFSYLECALPALNDTRGSNISTCDWTVLTIMLELGSMYE